jgi:uncharacterized protein (TIGR02391 family)
MSNLARFERIAWKAAAAAPQIEEPGPIHPFDERNIHPAVANVARKLFDNAHYPQATFEACKLIDKEVSKIGGVQKTGFDLMMQTFNENGPTIKLTDLSGMSEIDEQRGYRHMFAGTMSAIRNPRGHEYGLSDPVALCLDHLSVVSVLLRRLEARVAP